MEFANKITDYVKGFSKPLKIAVMGCVVNGPGEAKECDLGIAGAEEYCVIFKGGEIVRRVKAECAEQEFMKEIDKILNDR